MSKEEKKYFFEALFRIVWFKLVLFFIPFSKINNEKFKSSKINHTIELDKVKAVQKAINRANKFVFWKNKCFVNCLASQKMLLKRNINTKINLGVLKVNQKLKAHAWLSFYDDKYQELLIFKEDENYVKLF
jgi:hypothetical protein